jgi:uncharacterized protein YyaL (SSP411 family)
MTEIRNHLALENSPYLLQHADNPVDWYPWSNEAFEKAHEEDKPIFLSIGYSTCHWCHVMEHESFEDSEVAELMNDAFVSIKVDREERPDIDNVYMSVAQAMTGGGGWPLTIFMTPDKKPFFAATYIPKTSWRGQPGLMELIPEFKEAWKRRKEDIVESAQDIIDLLKSESAETGGEELGDDILGRTYSQLASKYDEKHGGFGDAPKFPMPHNLMFLLRQWSRSGDEQVLKMVELTLKSMRRGGIYDHVGFGFHRYSTDEKWLVPHFEKMIYDQALNSMAYVEAYQATENKEYKKTAEEIFDYVLRDMTSKDGAFYTAEDADSEGEEGKFYLGEEGATVESRIIRFEVPLSEKDEQFRKQLFEARKKRVRPSKDDKVLTGWNGLMIAALAKGGRVFDEPRYTEAAEQAVEFILNNLMTSKGRLLHRWRNGEGAINGMAEDYAFLIWGLLELYETTFDVEYLGKAIDLNNEFIEHFWDKDKGGFFFTADYSEQVLIRPKEIHDGAIPSANSVAAINLVKLARMTGNSELEKRVDAIGKAFSEQLAKIPSAHAQFMVALDFLKGPSYEVVVVGDPEAEDTKKMLDALRSSYIPNKVVLMRPSDEEEPEISKIAEFTKTQKRINGKATAYVCMNFACKRPTNRVEEMLSLLRAK